MKLSVQDTVTPQNPGQAPDYNDNNPLHQLIKVFESLQLAAEREHYPHDRLEVLFPFESLDLYGPTPPNETVLDPQNQDFVDFQKQNIRSFVLGDIIITRGWVTVDDWTGPFLRISYRGGPDSKLSKASGQSLAESILLYLKVGSIQATQPVLVPYNEASDRYEVEFWPYPGSDLRSKLDTNGQTALDRGELQIRSDIVQGAVDAFRREAVSDQPIPQVSPNHTMHPTNTLRIELAWADHTLQHWDSRSSQNYVYEFSMLVRG
ncbi:MAG: hypothetical protein U0936_18485 [Planctomycetaceae bacterium]